MAKRHAPGWECKECGQKTARWVGSCPTCSKWNTLVESIETHEEEVRYVVAPPTKTRPIRMTEVKEGALERMSSGSAEYDRLLGGGLVVGSLILVGGEPGIGKSTLLLQVAGKMAQAGKTVLYISAEESIEQTTSRARRLGLMSDKLLLLSDTLFGRIRREVEMLKPDLLIVDSIQILYKAELPAGPGSLPQVREITTELLLLSKTMNITTLLIGHVTKSGDIAGPKVLEHLVDVVLEFEGDRHGGFRLLRALKNRFGPTDEIALYSMTERGLEEVTSPSTLFLQERGSTAAPGCAVAAIIEGSRPLLVEIQALASASNFATSSRRSTGFDSNRLALLIAVLEKRVGLHLHACDLFVSVAGGLKIQEPASDLAVLLAIASSFSNRVIPSDLVVMGEVGLSGELRHVTKIEHRLKEALQMGFTRAIIPERCLAGLNANLKSKIDIVGVPSVEKAISHVLS